MSVEDQELYQRGVEAAKAEVVTYDEARDMMQKRWNYNGKPRGFSTISDSDPWARGYVEYVIQLAKSSAKVHEVNENINETFQGW